MTTENAILDCAVIGGGAAGLSAALTLGRARRTTLLIDAGRQSNLPAHGIGGLLGHDRRPPAELYADGRSELREYPTVTVRDGEVAAAAGTAADGFELTLVDGMAIRARRLLLAGGMDYRYPEVAGADERWGESVFHCPFCHGWEVAGRPLAVLSAPPAGVHQALLLTAWSDSVTLLAGGTVAAPLGADALSAPDRERLAAAGVAVEERPVAALHGPGRALEAVEFSAGASLAVNGVLVATTLHQRNALVRELGVAFADANPMTEEAIEIDFMHRTSVAGVSAAGDITVGPPSVTRAIAAGGFAAAMVVGGLTGAM